MDNGGDRLHLTHALTDGDALTVQREEAVRAILQRFEVNGNRRSSAQRLHEDLVVLHITTQIRCKLRQGLAVCLRYIEDRDRLEHGDFDFLFLHDDLAIGIKHRLLGIGVQFLFLDLLFERRWGDDFDTFFAFLDIALKLVTPFVKPGNQCGVGSLHIDEHGVVDAVLVEAAHGTKVLSVLVRLKKFLYPFFNAVGNVFESFFACLLFGHTTLLSK